VHISQSGVSAPIRQLERELGTELFDRSARTATLTVAERPRSNTPAPRLPPLGLSARQSATSPT